MKLSPYPYDKLYAVINSSLADNIKLYLLYCIHYAWVSFASKEEIDTLVKFTIGDVQ